MHLKHNPFHLLADGFNRISQVCETYVVGFEFLVLYDTFVVHRGFKTETNFHATKVVR